MKFKNWLLTEGKKDKRFFDYHYLAEDRWHDLVKEAKKKFKVSFDTENDESVAQRIISFDENGKYKFACEMRKAGGDWESPIVYFRCQLLDGYLSSFSRYSSSAFFCFVPVKDEGNEHMVQGKLCCAPDSDCKEKPNEAKCWESLKSYLKDLVRKHDKDVENGNL